MKYPQKPPNMSDEEWEENYLYPLAEKKVDNANQSAVQFRLYTTLKRIKKALIVLVLISVGILGVIDVELLVQAVGGLIFLYLVYQLTINDETWSIWDIFKSKKD
jgi:uncharacterized Tic20 family protein